MAKTKTKNATSQSSIDLSEYKGMWLFVMFDLPVDSKDARRIYTRFRKELLKLGFDMLQFSIYARYYGTEEASAPVRKRIRKSLPPDGQVRLLSVTDRQFGKMEVYLGKSRQTTEAPPDQLMLL